MSAATSLHGHVPPSAAERPTAADGHAQSRPVIRHLSLDQLVEEAVRSLVAVAPHAFTKEPLRRLLTRDSPQQVVRFLDGLLTQGAHREAVAVCVASMVIGASGPGARNPVPDRYVIRLALNLIETERVELAAELEASLASLLRSRTATGQGVDKATERRHQAIVGLLGAGDALPGSTRAILARASYRGDFGEARETLMRWALRNPEPARIAASSLREHSVYLWEELEYAFSTAATGETPRAARRPAYARVHRPTVRIERSGIAPWKIAAAVVGTALSVIAVALIL